MKKLNDFIIKSYVIVLPGYIPWQYVCPYCFVDDLLCQRTYRSDIQFVYGGTDGP